MSLKKDYNGHGKTQVGPGGLKCPCCIPGTMGKHKVKHFSRRLIRRVNKQALKNFAHGFEKNWHGVKLGASKQNEMSLLHLVDSRQGI